MENGVDEEDGVIILPSCVSLPSFLFSFLRHSVILPKKCHSLSGSMNADTANARSAKADRTTLESAIGKFLNLIGDASLLSPSLCLSHNAAQRSTAWQACSVNLHFEFKLTETHGAENKQKRASAAWMDSRAASRRQASVPFVRGSRALLTSTHAYSITGQIPYESECNVRWIAILRLCQSAAVELETRKYG